MEWISTAVGGVMSKAAGGDVSTGAETALGGTKWNYSGFEISQERLIQNTLKRKDGKPISEDEARDLEDEMQEIAYDIDPSEKDHGNRLVIGSNEVIDAVKKALLNKGYTTDSVELYVSEYKKLVNEVNDSIPVYLRPVNVIANGAKMGEITADAVQAGKEVVYPLKMAGAMFDINDVIQSQNPQDEIFVIGSGKFSAAIVGSVVIGVGTHTTLSPWIIYGISGVAEWSVEEKVKSYFEDQLKKFREKQNSEKSDENTKEINKK